MAAAPRRTLVATAWLHGRLADEVRCETGRSLEVGPSGRLGVPAPAGAPYVVRAEWLPSGDVSLRDGRGEEAGLTLDEEVRYRVGPVEVSLRLAPTRWLRRTAPFAWGASLSWFVLLMSVSLLVEQGGVLYRHRCDWFGLDCAMETNAGPGFDAQLIARLANQETGGNVDRRKVYVPDPRLDDVKLPSEYLPAGDDGPKTEMGGAKRVASEPVRKVGSRARRSSERAEARPAVEETVTAPQGTPLPSSIREDASKTAPEELGLDEQAEAQDPGEGERAEEVLGWGLRDWMDAQDPRQREELERELMKELARQRLRIDPEDPWALSLTAYYQYLNEDYQGATETYDRLLAVEPESPAVYNNKALVYKRQHRYEEEEGLYRVALSLDPDDRTALNNLAVNLAHQGRYDEALAVMDQVDLLRVQEGEPYDPYADLHRAKIHAARGDDEQALAYLRAALEGMENLDTLHHIEFRQDIRLDPVFDKLRRDARFRGILSTYYGEDSPLGGSP